MTTRNAAVDLLDAGATDDSRAVYLVAMRGNFSSPRPDGLRTRSQPEWVNWSIQTLVVDAETGFVTDSGAVDTYPALASLGPVLTDHPTDGVSGARGGVAQTVRRATIEDAAQLTALLRAGGSSLGADALARTIQRQGDFGCVLFTEHGLLSMNRTVGISGDVTAGITTLFVDPEFRDQGHGKALLRAAQEVAQAWDCVGLEVLCPVTTETVPAQCLLADIGYESLPTRVTLYRMQLIS